MQQAGAALEIEIGGTMPGTQYDRLSVSGTASLGGTLAVSLLEDFMPVAGNAFEILTAAGGIVGTFDTEMLPPLANDLIWDVNYSTNSVILVVAAPSIPGDFNGDGTVTAADYVSWRKTGGTQAEYNDWRSNFGATTPSGSLADSSSHAAVPELDCAALLIGALATCAAGSAGQQRRPRR